MNVLNLALPLSVLVSFIATELILGLTVTRAVYAWSLAFLPPVVFGYILAGTAIWPRKLMAVARLRPLLVFGIQSQAGNLIQLLNYRLDAYLILILTNAAGVGLWQAAATAGRNGRMARQPTTRARDHRMLPSRIVHLGFDNENQSQFVGRV